MSDKFVECGPKIDQQCVTGGPTVALRDGRILFTYSGPVNPHGQEPGTVRIYGCVSDDDCKSWGAEQEFIHHPECQATGATLLKASDGTLWMFYMGFYRSVWREGEPDMQETRSDIWCVHSTDEAETWQAPKMIFRGYCGATNGAIQTGDGYIVVPISYVVPKPGRLVSACLVSADNGQNFSLGKSIDLAGHGDHAGALEPAVVELRDGSIWMLIRTTKGEFFQAFSFDHGITWSEARPCGIRSPSAPCHIIRLASGRLALVWNDTMDTTKARTALSVALSEDDGKTWGEPVIAVSGAQVCYPYISEPTPGQLLISFNDVSSGWQDVKPRLLRVAEQTLLEKEVANV